MMAGHVIAYRGEDEVRDEDALVSFADIKQDGMVEISFDHGKERIWVSFKLHELIREIAEAQGSET